MKPREDRASPQDLAHASALAAEHHERLPSRLPHWRLDGSLFAALSTATFDLRPSFVSRDGETGFMIDATEQRFMLVGMEALDYAQLRANGQPWQVTAIAEERLVNTRKVGNRWDAIDSLRFVACLLESSGCIAGPIELGKRYKMLKWPDLGALPSARTLLRPYLRHATALARGNRSVGELLASAGTDWREALAFANACAMLDLLQVVED